MPSWPDFLKELGQVRKTDNAATEVRGGIAISGISDLEPIRLNYLNEKIRETNASRSTGADRRGQVLWPTKSASS